MVSCLGPLYTWWRCMKRPFGGDYMNTKTEKNGSNLRKQVEARGKKKVLVTRCEWQNDT